MRLEVLTPVHIGDGEEIIPWEYAPRGSKVDIYPVEYLTQALARKVFGQRLRNVLLDLRNSVREEGFKSNLGQFLERNGLGIEPLYSLEKTKGVELFGNGEYRPIKSFLKTSGRVYIPGSEVKGALRTIFVYGVVVRELKRGNRKLFNFIRAIVRDAVKEVRGAEKKKIKKIWDKHSSRIEALVLREGSPDRRDAKYDLFKAVMVSDSEVKKPSEALFVDSIRMIGTKRHIYEVAEYINPGVSFEVRIDIDEDTKKALKRTMENQYIDLLNSEFLRESAVSFYRHLVSIDEKFFEKHSREIERDPHLEAKRAINSGDFILRIGKHQGFLSITLMSIIYADRELYREMYKLAVPNPRDEVNKTRTLTSEGYSIGWCKLS